ncbi:response regulator [Roseinatronobacter sp. S2]|uniref:response regulator n=1 Tax=Roseinatronobacter sp. S2 TaxID=3035471 RepID=UPI00240ECF46|nr:response regulator [Roseinatronobacter sp. S2]WFE74961.1 response regulator [Roseinatronobacter sp. S2]
MPATEAPLILCCEDEPQLLRDISDELQGAGYRVVEARNGAELLARLHDCAPDLVLCDIMMPEVDGYGVLARFRRDFPRLAHVPLVFLSALSMTDAVIRGKRAGADDYLTKPIDYELLLSTIEARLRQSAQARAGIARTAGIGQHLFNTLAFGVLVFTPDATLIAENPAAKCLMKGPAGQSVTNALADTVRRMGARARAGVEDSVSLLLDDAPSLMAQVHACPTAPDIGTPAMVVVFLTDPAARAPLSAGTLESLFSLTPTEARVARYLAFGCRPDEIAREMDVAPTTVAFHLRNAFGKTGTHRQADLVALLLSLPVHNRE